MSKPLYILLAFGVCYPAIRKFFYALGVYQARKEAWEEEAPFMYEMIMNVRGLKNECPTFWSILVGKDKREP